MTLDIFYSQCIAKIANKHKNCSIYDATVLALYAYYLLINIKLSVPRTITHRKAEEIVFCRRLNRSLKCA